MKLELGIMAGPESKAFLVDLTKLVERMERAVSSDRDRDVGTTSDDAPEEDEDFGATKKATKKAAAKVSTPFDDEVEEFELEADEEEEDFTKPAKKTKTVSKVKKITLDEVNDACKALAADIGGKAGREKVLAILKKNFKTTSVSELKPDQYAACVAAMEA